MGTPSGEVETWVKAEPPRSAGYRVGSGQHSRCRVWWAVGASTFRSVRGHPGLAGGVFKYQHTEHRLGCSLEMDFSRLGPGAQPQPLGLTSSQGPASPSSPEQRGCPPWSPEPPEASWVPVEANHGWRAGTGFAFCCSLPPLLSMLPSTVLGNSRQPASTCPVLLRGACLRPLCPAPSARRGAGGTHRLDPTGTHCIRGKPT